MSDGQVRELAQQPETKGKQTAFRQILEDISGKQAQLPERISFFNGQRSACAVLEERIQGLITQRIAALAEKGVAREQIKDEQAFAHSLKRLAHNIGQDAMQEQLMLKGEARALLGQVESIGNLSKKAIADERTLEALESGQNAIRQQFEDTKPEPEPESIAQPQQEKKAAIEPKKTPARRPAKSSAQRRKERRSLERDKSDGSKG